MKTYEDLGGQYLEHYGIKGMKWRRKHNILSDKTENSRKKNFLETFTKAYVKTDNKKRRPRGRVKKVVGGGTGVFINRKDN